LERIKVADVQIPTFPPLSNIPKWSTPSNLVIFPFSRYPRPSFIIVKGWILANICTKTLVSLQNIFSKYFKNSSKIAQTNLSTTGLYKFSTSLFPFLAAEAFWGVKGK